MLLGFIGVNTGDRLGSVRHAWYIYIFLKNLLVVILSPNNSCEDFSFIWQESYCMYVDIIGIVMVVFLSK